MILCIIVVIVEHGALLYDLAENESNIINVHVLVDCECSFGQTE